MKTPFFKSSLGFLTILLGTLSIAPAREPVAQPSTPATKEAAPVQYDKAIKVEPLLVTSTTVDGAPIVYPKTDNPEVRILLIDVPAGAETGWHKHPSPCYGYVISGSITVELENGIKNTFTAGQALAEVVNTVHNGKNSGTETTRLLMVVTGEKGAPNAVATPKTIKTPKAPTAPTAP